MQTFATGRPFFGKSDFDREAKHCADFLANFEDPALPVDPLHGRKKYICDLVVPPNPATCG